MFDFIKDELKVTQKEKQSLTQAVESEKQRIAQARKDKKKSAVRSIRVIDALGIKLDAKKDEKALDEFRAAEESRLKSIQSARRRSLVNQNRKSIIGMGVGVAAVLIAVSVFFVSGSHSFVPEPSQLPGTAIVESGNPDSPQAQTGHVSAPANNSQPADCEPEVKSETMQSDVSTGDKDQPNDMVTTDVQQAAIGNEDIGTPNTPTQTPSSVPAPIPEPDSDSESAAPDTTYILNLNTKKFHRPGCHDVKRMSEENKVEFTGARADVIAQGYDPCQKCHP